jgi:hypothetical protein
MNLVNMHLSPPLGISNSDHGGREIHSILTWTRAFTESEDLLPYSRTGAFTESEDLLPYSQEATIGLYSEPDDPKPYSKLYF